mmetsp:Transcript_35067/g.48629  ORF Transcript_35067/g.48629 Transcript_35067/m.48629 type:complete len:211 (+) Transcript_35067:173-805(+)
MQRQLLSISCFQLRMFARNNSLADFVRFHFLDITRRLFTMFYFLHDVAFLNIRTRFLSLALFCTCCDRCLFASTSCYLTRTNQGLNLFPQTFLQRIKTRVQMPAKRRLHRVQSHAQCGHVLIERLPPNLVVHLLLNPRLFIRAHNQPLDALPHLLLLHAELLQNKLDHLRNLLRCLYFDNRVLLGFVFSFARVLENPLQRCFVQRVVLNV